MVLFSTDFNIAFQIVDKPFSGNHFHVDSFMLQLECLRVHSLSQATSLRATVSEILRLISHSQDTYHYLFADDTQVDTDILSTD